MVDVVLGDKTFKLPSYQRAPRYKPLRPPTTPTPLTLSAPPSPAASPHTASVQQAVWATFAALLHHHDRRAGALVAESYLREWAAAAANETKDSSSVSVAPATPLLTSLSRDWQTALRLKPWFLAQYQADHDGADEQEEADDEDPYEAWAPYVIQRARILLILLPAANPTAPTSLSLSSHLFFLLSDPRRGQDARAGASVSALRLFGFFSLLFFFVGSGRPVSAAVDAFALAGGQLQGQLVGSLGVCHFVSCFACVGSAGHAFVDSHGVGSTTLLQRPLLQPDLPGYHVGLRSPSVQGAPPSASPPAHRGPRRFPANRKPPRRRRHSDVRRSLLLKQRQQAKRRQLGWAMMKELFDKSGCP